MGEFDTREWTINRAERHYGVIGPRAEDEIVVPQVKSALEAERTRAERAEARVVELEKAAEREERERRILAHPDVQKGFEASNEAIKRFEDSL